MLTVIILEQLPKRKHTRLKDYDYSTPGAYFITICTKDKKPILGEVIAGDELNKSQMRLSPIGKIANREISKIESHYDNVKIDKFVVMPNHIHLIVIITERINPFPTSKKFDITNIIGKFKAAVTRNVGKAFMPSAKTFLWQTSFHDHIIRDERDYRKIWEYIDENPVRWMCDKFYITEDEKE